MNFSMTEEQRACVALARDFAEEKLQPNAADWDAQSYFPLDVLREAAQLGFAGLYAPVEAGGLGLSRLDSSMILEELAAGCTATTAYLSIHNMCAWMVGHYGQAEVVRHICRDLCSGKAWASYCLTEPDAGSDAASLRTRAVRDGREYVLQGQKAFISGAGSTDWLVVMARTGATGAAGISAFLVDANRHGISYGRLEDKMGWRCQPTRMIRFDEVRIPAEYRLGEEGDGFAIAMRGLDGGRINIGSCSLGTAQAALMRLQQHVQVREQFGKPLAALQTMQFQLADMATRLVAARQMIRLAAWKLDQSEPDASVFCAMAKQMATDTGFDVCNQALQGHGGYGYLRDYPLERYVRDCRVHQILEGTNEIMRLIVARRVLRDDSMLWLQNF